MVDLLLGFNASTEAVDGAGKNALDLAQEPP